MENSPVSLRLRTVKHIIVVLSGKGGVGKSSVTSQLALSLYASSPSARVGILDIDLTGPSIPRMLGVDGHPVHQSSDGWVPVYADGAERRLACMSVGFLVKRRGDSVVWRGPKKNGMIRQFLSDVRWGELDYLVVDTPPGTSDEHLSLLEHLAGVHEKLSAVIVTTPQAVALMDTMKCLSFTRTVNLPVLGLIENMSGYVCPCCGDISAVFSTGGGVEMARREGLTMLGALPIEGELVTLLDAAAAPVPTPDSTSAPVPGRAAASASEQASSPTSAVEGEPGTAARPPSPGKDGSNTNGAGDSGSAFPLLSRYERTSSSKVFKGIVKTIIEALGDATKAPSSSE